MNSTTAVVSQGQQQREQQQRSFSFANLFKGRAGAATMAGVLEIAFFHPFDTVAKRLMTSRTRIQAASLEGTLRNLNTTIFLSKADASVAQKFLYLYPGSAYAVCYKILQRVYKFAGQPLVRDHLFARNQQTFTTLFGRRDRLMIESVSGCIIGLGEVLLLPLDRLKVLSQANEAVMRRGVLQLLRQEGVRGMYAGTVVTMARNAPGSFCLFGGTAFTKDVVFGLEDYRRATLFQNLCASTVGACLSITVTNPMDVIKIRVQNKDPGAQLSAVAALSQLLREEGATALFKGLTPKVIASAPKLIFAYSMTEFFMQLMNAKKAVAKPS
ncbi:mitochondrial carrier protein [Trypanosoma rangeli]|uniref:Mitochondrial carrier protein n=1 Tax=Trypanosoma rangeli TaxID=5698 RepID=A0A422NAX9_TRYRA|nr:mitochondrial carrier protein [Trypanosoma rangeli]RNF02630.1 mitochondrial carrier protein [Trypanosoma rangeli]|eukprot:RNF02630.1 mitochondrial carrier protein [Trypanosoma rangeli]